MVAARNKSHGMTWLIKGVPVKDPGSKIYTRYGFWNQGPETNGGLWTFRESKGIGIVRPFVRNSGACKA